MSNNKFKILIVEDEPTICSFIYTLLDTNGYKTYVPPPVSWANPSSPPTCPTSSSWTWACPTATAASSSTMCARNS